jgi:hypothetical protein
VKVFAVGFSPANCICFSTLQAASYASLFNDEIADDKAARNFTFLWRVEIAEWKLLLLRCENICGWLLGGFLWQFDKVGLRIWFGIRSSPFKEAWHALALLDKPC